MVGISVSFGEMAFASKSDARLYVSDMLSLYRPGERLIPQHLSQICALIRRHPESEEKIGVGIRAISVEKHPEFRSKCFVIHREDGTTTDVSYIACINAKPKCEKRRLFEAMRYAVKEQILRFKWARFGDKTNVLRCELTGVLLSWEESHIDHVKPFDEIANEFLDDLGIEPSKELLTANADNQYFETISDRLVLILWQDYHEKNATLRVISKAANLGRKKGDD